MTRTLTRLQSIIAGGAFAVAGIGGITATTMDHPTHTTPDTTAAVTAPASNTIPAAALAPTVQAPSDQDLHPVAVTGSQQQFTPDADQLANTKAIIDAGKDLNLPPRAWEIAVATSLQESNLHNLGNLGAHNDHDSLGLFQQRPSTGGWGTADQIMDPHHAATSFYQRLTAVPGWDTMPLTKAAQKVQVSGVPNGYAKHETQAANMIDASYGTGPYADASK